jgi:hypothetical protein
VEFTTFPVLMHKFAFLVRAPNHEIAHRIVDGLMSSRMLLGGNPHNSEAGVQMGEMLSKLFEGLPVTTDVSNVAEDVWSSVFDPYYHNFHHCPTNLVVNTNANVQKTTLRPVTDCPVTLRVPCVLNYLYLFSGVVAHKVPLRLAPSEALLETLVSTPSASISLKPYVVYAINDVLPKCVNIPVLVAQNECVSYPVLFDAPVQTHPFGLCMGGCVGGVQHRNHLVAGRWFPRRPL